MMGSDLAQGELSSKIRSGLRVIVIAMLGLVFIASTLAMLDSTFVQPDSQALPAVNSLDGMLHQSGVVEDSSEIDERRDLDLGRIERLQESVAVFPNQIDLQDALPERRLLGFKITNSTPYVLHVVGMKQSCSCSSITIAERIMPQDSSDAEFQWDLTHVKGMATTYVNLEYNLMSDSMVVASGVLPLRASAVVRPQIVASPEVIRLIHSESSEMHVELAAATDTLSVEQVVARHPAFHTEVCAAGFQLTFDATKWGLGAARQELRVVGFNGHRSFVHVIPVYIR